MRLASKSGVLLSLLLTGCLGCNAVYAASSSLMQQKINARAREIIASKCAKGCRLAALEAQKKQIDIESQAYTLAMKRIERAIRMAHHGNIGSFETASNSRSAAMTRSSVVRKRKMSLWKRAALAKRNAEIAKYRAAIRRHQANIMRQKKALQQYDD